MERLLVMPRRTFIRALHKRGFSLAAFARERGFSPNTVQVVARRYVGTGRRPLFGLDSFTVAILDGLAKIVSELDHGE